MRSDPAGRLYKALTLLVLLPAALALLRAAILGLGALVPPVAEYQAVVAERGLRPAALFYTEVPLALAAEKRVRERVRATVQEESSPH